MRSLHYTNKHIENAGNGLTTLVGALVIAAAFGAIFTNGGHDSQHRSKRQEVPQRVEMQRGDISETQYLLAVMQGGSEGRKVKLSESQLQTMDHAAIAATPRDCLKRIKCQPEKIWDVVDN
jgi:hypothetical protein